MKLSHKQRLDIIIDEHLLISGTGVCKAQTRVLLYTMFVQ